MQRMIEVKTSELEGSALDWAVAQVDGRATRVYLCPVMDEYKVAATVPGGDLESAWMPSIDWGQGGPLIESNQWALPYRATHRRHIGDFEACTPAGFPRNGSTPLIAAMRAIVAAKLGDFVSVPAELMP